MCQVITQRRVASILAAILAAILVSMASLAGAEDAYPNQTAPNQTASADTVAADLLVARPGGLAATVLGAAVFVVGLPFTLINGSTEQAAQKLVVEPAQYTFARPLGQDMSNPGRSGSQLQGR